MIFNFFLSLLLVCLPFQLGKHFWPQFSYVLGLKIDFLSPTLYLQDLMVIILILCWLLDKSKNKFTKKSLIIPISCIFVSALNILFSINHWVSLFWWIRLAELMSLGVIVCQNSYLVVRNLYRYLPFWLIFEFVLGVIQFLKQSSVGGLFWFFGERSFNIFTPGIARSNWLGNVLLRPYGTFSHPNSLAGFILVSLILIMGKSKLRLIDKIGVICGFLLIILEFSRTVWLFVFILSLIYVFRMLYLNFKRKSGSLNFTYLFVLVCLGLMTFLFLKTTIDPSSFTARADLARVAIKLIRERPLLGIGGNSFILALANEPNFWHYLYWLQPVHNIYLLVGSELGLTGLILFSVLIYLTIRKLFDCYLASLLIKQDIKILRYQDNKLTESSLSLIVALFTILFTGLFDHYWLTLIQNQLLFSIIFGLSFIPFRVKMNAWNKGKE